MEQLLISVWMAWMGNQVIREMKEETDHREKEVPMERKARQENRVRWGCQVKKDAMDLKEKTELRVLLVFLVMKETSDQWAYRG